MNREDIIRMAQEAGGYVANFNGRWVFYADNLERFAESVEAQAAAELRRLHQICRDIYEVWAGSEATLMPETAVEAYLLRLVEQMRDIAKEGLR